MVLNFAVSLWIYDYNCRFQKSITITVEIVVTKPCHLYHICLQYGILCIWIYACVCMNMNRLLIQLVEQYGLRKWSHIAKMLPGRIGKQCRERWHNHLRPDIKVQIFVSYFMYTLSLVMTYMFWIFLFHYAEGHMELWRG